jgi:glutamate 5-kinase
MVQRITPEIEALAGSSGSEVAVGGMRTKIEAARIVTGSGEMMLIANGKKDSLIDILDGKDIGTLFLAQTDKRASRKRWIAFNMDGKGTVEVDAGAARALVERGRSLLASGITAVHGMFQLGDMIGILDPPGREIARGLTNYSTEELNKIRGRKSSEFEKILGYRSYDEVVHRDNLVLM